MIWRKQSRKQGLDELQYKSKFLKRTILAVMVTRDCILKVWALCRACTTLEIKRKVSPSARQQTSMLLVENSMYYICFRLYRTYLLMFFLDSYLCTKYSKVKGIRKILFMLVTCLQRK